MRSCGVTYLKTSADWLVFLWWNLMYDVWLPVVCGVQYDDVMTSFIKTIKTQAEKAERYSWSLSFSSPVLFKLGCVEDISWKNSTGRTICLAMADSGKLPPRLCTMAQKANRLDLDDSLILKIMSFIPDIYAWVAKWLFTSTLDLETDSNYL